MCAEVAGKPEDTRLSERQRWSPVRSAQLAS